MKYTSPGFRSVEASSMNAAAVIFAERAARKQYGNVVFEFTAKGVDYDACLGDLAAEMAIYAEEPLMNWEIFIRPR